MNTSRFLYFRNALITYFTKSSFQNFGIVVSILAYSFLIYKLFTFNQYDKLVLQWKQMPLSQFWWLVGVLVLLPFNWYFESLKWKQLVSKVQKINLKNSFKSVLAGISTGFFTPNRIGDLVGRVIYLNAENRKAGVTLSMLNSLSQNLIMAVCGIPFCILFISLNTRKFKINLTLYLIILILCLLIFGFVYFMLPQLSKRFKQKKNSEKIKSFTDCLLFYNKQDLLKILLISLGRYVVFCVQFYLMLRFLNVGLSVQNAFIAIPTTYLLITFTPSVAFSEIAVRSSFAVLVIGIFSSQIASIAIASICIWIINFVIPMMVGTILMVRKKKQILLV